MKRPPIIGNRWLPPGRFLAITLFGMVFTRDKKSLGEVDVNHEWIHCRQQLEWLYIPFFIIYIAEYLAGYVRYRDSYRAYRSISFEREAYGHESDFGYLKRRPPFATFRRPI